MPVQIWTIIGVGQYLIPVIVLLQIKVPPKSWAYLIIYPIFMYSWIPVNFLGFKDRHKMKWSHTLHTRPCLMKARPYCVKKIRSKEIDYAYFVDQ